MTTIHAASASSKFKNVLPAALLALSAAGLGGCETANSVFGPSADTGAQIAQPAPTPQPPRARVALAPVIGAPEGVGKQIAAELSSRLEGQRVSITKAPSDPFDYTVRGYVVAAKERTGTKVSYIWDVTDPAGKRINRITGEEIGASSQGRDPWTVVTPEMIRTIADRTTTSLVAALPPPSAASGSPGDSSVPVASSGAVAGATVQRTAAAAPSAVAAPVGTTTGSIAASQTSVTVPRVTGAPGDGPQSLSTALQRELSRNGLTLSGAGQQSTHRVEGRVIMGQAQKSGDPQRDVQPIQIDWVVKNARGENLGTVSQKNEIRPGELDGPWGKTADAAAAAAAQGILKLLQQQQTAAN